MIPTSSLMSVCVYNANEFADIKSEQIGKTRKWNAASKTQSVDWRYLIYCSTEKMFNSEGRNNDKVLEVDASGFYESVAWTFFLLVFPCWCNV